mmetsp:Transcript_41275/g.58064  ORF Transcript_41275/g.58064 Transcript_41275/m.58064 type:complete len:152 (-) Transcript_41275:64-519(-)
MFLCHSAVVDEGPMPKILPSKTSTGMSSPEELNLLDDMTMNLGGNTATSQIAATSLSVSTFSANATANTTAAPAAPVAPIDTTTNVTLSPVSTSPVIASTSAPVGPGSSTISAAPVISVQTESTQSSPPSASYVEPSYFERYRKSFVSVPT